MASSSNPYEHYDDGTVEQDLIDPDNGSAALSRDLVISSLKLILWQTTSMTQISRATAAPLKERL